MHIVVFAHFAGSPKHGMVFGHYYLAREWVLAGHEVTIVAASFSHVRKVNPPRRWGASKENIDGIDYVWLPTPVYQAGGRLGRVLNILAYSFASLVYQFFSRSADLVVCSSHHPFPIVSARLLAARCQARLVFEVRDLWPLTLIELGGASKRNPFIVLMQRFEDYSYRCADKVVSVLQHASNYMVSRGMSEEKFVFLPNGVDLSVEGSCESLPRITREFLVSLRAEGKFLVGYAGKVGFSNALDVLLEAISSVRDVDVCAVILGDGECVETLRMLAEELGIESRVFFLSGVPKSQVQDFLGLVDVAYIGLRRHPLFRYGVSPTKLNDYMLAAKPVIYAVDAPGNVILESRAGINCPAEDPCSLAEAIVRLREMPPSDLRLLGLSGLSWIKNNRSYTCLASRFLSSVL